MRPTYTVVIGTLSMDVILAEMFGKKPSFQFPTMITLKSFGNWYTYSSRNGWGLRAETQDMRAEAQDLRAEAQDLGAEAQLDGQS